MGSTGRPPTSITAIRRRDGCALQGRCGRTPLTSPLCPSRRLPAPWDAAEIGGNAALRLRFWKCAAGRMQHLVRNGDGDELLFVHRGAGELFCDFGHLSFAEGDYILLPRGTMWRTESEQPLAVLLIEATQGSYRLPDKGLAGPHALFDAAMLDVPQLDELFRAQQSDTERWEVRVKRRARDLHDHLSLQSARRRRLARRPRRCAHQRPRHSPVDEPSLSPAALGAHHFRGRPVRRVHIRAATLRV